MYVFCLSIYLSVITDADVEFLQPCHAVKIHGILVGDRVRVGRG
jgi:hypothetical protein